MTLLSEALNGRTTVKFNTNVKQGKVSMVPRQPANINSFLKEGHSISPSAVLRRKWQ
jgi:hypothetical protein